ncbi:MAG: hypothetical protein ACPGNV_06535 [Mangrovicoccus sp.]
MKWIFAAVTAAALGTSALAEIPPSVETALESQDFALAADAAFVLAEDVQALNALRLELKTQGREKEAEKLFKALLAKSDTAAVRFNLSLAYVDQMIGKSLLRQGQLSSRSQDMVKPLTEQPGYAWDAAYIIGLNNLYWPDWFGKAEPAREALEQALALTPDALSVGDKYALGWIALGDAYALLDRNEDARATWQAGALRYPYRPEFAARLALPDATLHADVRAIRDANKPVDTDLAFLWQRAVSDFSLTLTGGQLFGPGPLPDQPLNPGGLQHLKLDHQLTGEISAFNNGADEPNLPGELKQGLTIDGKLSNGTGAHEHIDVGYVELMNGAFKLFLAAIVDGPHAGQVNFFLDDQYAWTIYDDIGIDPGFAEGVIELHNFSFSAAPRLLPISWQTENNAPGATDIAGSLASGDAVPARLGDSDGDGYLDGIFNAIGRFPLGSIMLPGAPFAQTRIFTTDIPVSAEAAALLTLANRRLHLIQAHRAPQSAPALTAAADLQASEIALHLERAANWQAGLAPAQAEALARLTSLSADMPLAELCAARGDLDLLGPLAGLFRSNTKMTGVTDACAAR